MKLSPEDQKLREMAAVRRAMGPATLRTIEIVPTDSLIPYAQNARTHDDKQISIIERSIQTFGIVNPPLVDANNVIIAGHGRVEAAKRLGITEIPVLRVEVALSPFELVREVAPSDFDSMERFLIDHWQPKDRKDRPVVILGDLEIDLSWTVLVDWSAAHRGPQCCSLLSAHGVW